MDREQTERPARSGVQNAALTMTTTVAAAAVGLLALFVIFSLGRYAALAADRSLVTAHAVFQELYRVRERWIREGTVSLAREAGLSEVVGGDSGKLAVLLRRHPSLSGGVVVIFDEVGHLIASSRPDLAPDQPRAVAAALRPGGLSEMLLGGRPYQVAFAPLSVRGRTYWLVGGLGVDRELAEQVSAATGLDVSFRWSRAGTPAVTSSGLHPGATGGHRLTVPLSEGPTRLYVDFHVTDADAMYGLEALQAEVLAAAFTCIAAAILLAALWLRRIVRGCLDAPLQEVSSALKRVGQGVYTRPARVLADGPLGALARTVNWMQSEIAEREGRMVFNSEFDSLTGLINRSMANQRLRSTFERARAEGVVLAGLLIDIRHFDIINGTLGSDVGDQVLKEVARRLAGNTRATDTLARVGGDEFLVVVEDMDPRLVASLGAFLADTLEKTIVCSGREINLRVHVGIALFPNHCDNAEDLRRMTNIALNVAKDSEQRVAVYEPGQDERHLRDLAILNDLPLALQRNELSLQYQPKMEMSTRSVSHVEALVRWCHPQLGYVPPDEFVGVLERNNQIHVLTAWVLRAAIAQCSNWNERGFDLGIAVNLSANDLLDRSLPERVQSLLQHFLVEPSRVTFEVTESAVMRDPATVSEVLHALRRIGIRLAIDDFGTGQTSLSLLKELPLNEVKIDKSFVQNLRTDSGDGVIVKSTIDLGHNMGLRVVAEGVESTYAWNLLNSFKCDVVQGFLVSKPLEAEDLESWFLRLQAKQVSRLDFGFLQSRSEAEAGDESGGDGNELISAALGRG